MVYLSSEPATRDDHSKVQIPSLAVCFYSILCSISIFCIFCIYLQDSTSDLLLLVCNFHQWQQQGETPLWDCARVYNSFLRTSHVFAFPLCILITKQSCILFYVCPSCSTGNFIPLSNWTHTLATSTYFTDKGSSEKILTIPIPSSRIFFFMLLYLSVSRAAWLQSIFTIWGQGKCQATKQTETNRKKHSFSEQALLSVLRSKRVIHVAFAFP